MGFVDPNRGLDQPSQVVVIGTVLKADGKPQADRSFPSPTSGQGRPRRKRGLPFLLRGQRAGVPHSSRRPRSSFRRRLERFPPKPMRAHSPARFQERGRSRPNCLRLGEGGVARQDAAPPGWQAGETCPRGPQEPTAGLAQGCGCAAGGIPAAASASPHSASCVRTASCTAFRYARNVAPFSPCGRSPPYSVSGRPRAAVPR